MRMRTMSYQVTSKNDQFPRENIEYNPPRLADFFTTIYISNLIQYFTKETAQIVPSYSL